MCVCVCVLQPLSKELKEEVWRCVCVCVLQPLSEEMGVIGGHIIWSEGEGYAGEGQHGVGWGGCVLQPLFRGDEGDWWPHYLG